jgi:hypothetical protein
MAQRTISRLTIGILFLFFLPGAASSQELTRLPFPYGPLGLNSLP